MKSFVVVLSFVAFLSACKESFVERAVRESKEFTTKQCPIMTDARGVRLDSVVFSPTQMARIEYYTLIGEMGTSNLSDYEDEFKNALVQEVRNTVRMESYKDELVTFRFIYFLNESNELLFSIDITPEDYR